MEPSNITEEKKVNQGLPRQVIVIRKDLNMSAGKLAVQVAHASLAPVLNSMTNYTPVEDINITAEWTEKRLSLVNGSAMEKWINGRFTKIVVYVKSEQALMNVYEKALEKGLPCVLIKDAGFTEFSEPTITCVGIGPCFPEDFEGVTSKLRVFDGEVIPR